jgi:DNA repair exonuclease SbcCD nuclease subunit
MKRIICGDLHFGEKCSVDEFVAYQEREFDRMVDYATGNGIEGFVFLGDVLDNRKHINFKTLALVKSKMRRLVDGGFRVTIVVGNHDAFYKNTNVVNGPNEIFGDDESGKICVVYDRPCLDPMASNHLHMACPWITKANFDASVQQIELGTDYCYGHFEINGFVMNNSNVCRSTITPSMFKRFKRVFSGHFHTRSTQGNILYCGSLFQLDWNDYGQKKGFYVLDDETDTVEFVEAGEYVYKKIMIGPKFKFDSVADVENCFLKVYVNRKLSKKDQLGMNDLLSRNISFEIIDNTVLDDVNSEDVDFSSDFEEIVEIGVEAQDGLEDNEKKDVLALIRKMHYDMRMETNE